ncbi:MAG: hypothetical protein M3Z04_00900 [Chloroflexota bacterium]|nr:hypothetical protein [Chloroflexota bacterium]
MPVTHILPLGLSPGAAVSPIAYVRHQLDRWQAGGDDRRRAESFFGTDDQHRIDQHENYVYRANRFGQIVILTTAEVRSGSKRATAYVDNAYGTDTGTLHARDEDSAFDVTVACILQETARCRMADFKIYYAPMQFFDMNSSILTTLRILRWCVPRGALGLNTWMSLTGGSNVLNTAMLTATMLMGTVGRLYYNYPTNIQLLRPASTTPEWEDSLWCDLPPLRIDQDEELYKVLDELNRAGAPLEDVELLHRLQTRKQNQRLFRYDQAFFRTYLLNKLTPFYIRRVGEHTNIINERGKKLLDFLNDKDIRALINRTVDIQLTPTEAQLEQIWPPPS